MPTQPDDELAALLLGLGRSVVLRLDAGLRLTGIHNPLLLDEWRQLDPASGEAPATLQATLDALMAPARARDLAMQVGAASPGAAGLYLGVTPLRAPRGGGAQRHVALSLHPAADGGLYGAADIVTQSEYRDFRLHVEFLIAEPGGNSGVYLQNRYEIQVLDGDSTDHGMAAVINEAAAPYHPYNGVGQWNAYDVQFRAARFENGERTEPARVTLYFNGERVHEDQPIQQVWGGPNSGIDGGNDGGRGITDTPGGIKLQAEGHDVRYRNIWIQEPSGRAKVLDFGLALAAGPMSALDLSPAPVAATGATGEVRFHSTQPGFGGRFAVVRDVGGNHGGVVGMLGRAQADAALPFRFGQILVPELRQLRAILRGVQHTRAHRQREPVALRVTQLRGNGGFECSGAQRLGHAAVDQIDQIAEIHHHQHVGRRAATLGGNTFGQTVPHEHGIDLDARRCSETVEQRLDQARLTRGVEVHFRGARGSTGQTACQGSHGTQQQPAQWGGVIHCVLLGLSGLAAKTSAAPGSTCRRMVSPGAASQGPKTCNSRGWGRPSRVK